MFVAPSVTHSVKNSTFSVYERQLQNKHEERGFQISGYSAQYFPVRPLIRVGESDGAWLVAQKAEERRKFNELLRRRDAIAKRTVKSSTAAGGSGLSEPEEEPTCLDGFYLLRTVRIDDPSFVCHVDISGRNLSDVKEEDLQLFDSVTSLKAGENLLRIEPLNGFPNLRELEMPFNGLRNLKLTADSFPNLEFLDVSYNELTKEDLFNIGLLKRLRRLHAGGNGLSELPEDLALPDIASDGEANQRFQNLECLMLDDNRLSDPKAFASLAGLRKLKLLSLEKNNFTGIPFLKVSEEADGISVTLSATSAASTSRGDRAKSARGSSSRRTARSSRHQHQATTSADAAGGGEDLVVIASRKSAVQRSPNEHAVVAASDDAADPAGDAAPPAAAERPPSAPVVVPSGQGESATSEVMKPTEAEAAEVHQEPPVTTKSEEPSPAAEDLDEGAANSPADEASAPPAAPVNDLPAPKSPFASTGEINRNVEQLNLQMMRLNRPASAPLVELAPFDLREIERVIGRRVLERRQASGPAPFPALRSLNIGGNQVAREESLIACGAWPMLAELLIHDNPLCRTRSGELPLLSRLLTQRLGVRVLRQKPQQGPKPRIEVEAKPSRRVVSRVPPVPKVNVDRLLLGIAAPPPAPQPQQPSEPQPDVVDDGDAASDWGDGGGGDGVFLTSVTDQAAEAAAKRKERSKEKIHVEDEAEEEADDEVDNIDLLLSEAFGDEADDEPLPQDVLGSVKALQYLLDHPVTLGHNRPPLAEAGAAYREHRATRPAPAPPARPTRAELARAAAETTRRAEPRVELPLTGLLRPPDPPPPATARRPLPPLRTAGNRRQLERPSQAEARSLLGGVQRRYQTVRDRSLQQAKEQAREKIAAMVDDIRDGVRRSLRLRQLATDEHEHEPAAAS